MAFSSNTSLSTQVYAPDNSGFTHTKSEQFVYFSGSNAGARHTFGMPSTELKKVANDFASKFAQQYEDEAKEAKNLFNELDNLVEDLDGLCNVNRYDNIPGMVDSLKKTGHIPLILSSATAASQYEMATRSLGNYDLEFYFGTFSNAAAQAKEYLVKQDLMRCIAEFRAKIHTMRYQLSADSKLFRLCNTLIMNLDDQVIRPNQKSMPSEYEQFDLFSTFCEKIKDIVSHFDPDLVEKDLITNIQNKIRSVSFGNNVDAQKKLSDDLYEILKKYIQNDLGISLDVKAELEMTEDQVAGLQIVLPLLSYLNSESNPFSRDGLIGSIVTNRFHEEALNAYKLHESKEKVDAGWCEINFKPIADMEYDATQISHLLFGSPQSKKTGYSMFSSMSNALKSFTGANSYDSVVPYSTQRRQQLSLPVPQVYLAIEAPKPDNKQNNGLKK